MKSKIYNYRNYRDFLTDWAHSQPKKGRGVQARLAKELRCHTTHVSQVFLGKSDLSLEQAADVVSFLGLSQKEGDYFLLLVQYERAGNRSLRQTIKRQMQATVEDYNQLKNRLEYDRVLEEGEMATYYRSWLGVAVHIAAGLPRLNSPQEIARFLGAKTQHVQEMVDFLLETGILVRKKDKLDVGTSRLHIGTDSPFLSQHHMNWRLFSAQAVGRIRPSEQGQRVNFSSVVTISHEDVGRVREILVKAIEKIRGIVRKSEDETVYTYLIDLMPLSQED